MARSLLGRGLLVVLFVLLQQVNAQEGILHVSRDSTSEPAKDYCILYNPAWTSLPKSLDNVTLYRLENLTTTTLCSTTDVPSGGFKGKAVMVQNGTCSVLVKARFAQGSGATMLLLVSKNGIITPTDNKTLFKDVSIPVIAIRYGDVMDMQKTLGDNVKVTLYSPAVKMFDYSMLVIFLIAVFTVTLGGYWSGVGELEDLRPAANTAEGEARKNKDENVTFTPLTVVIFVAVCCVMILLLYFFYKWLVYVIIAVFCLASAMSLFNCLAALIKIIPYGQCRVTCFKKTSEVRLLFLAAGCIAVAVVWAVYRNEDRWAWILQDLLGIAFCLNFIKTLRMPNFKACVILLVLLLIYDVFFVFITPFFTKSGESIMIEVAAGPSSGGKSGGSIVEVPAEPSTSREKLPVVIRVPRLEFSALTLCGMPFSLLGFGDIIVPGLLIAYCRRFEVRQTSSCAYYVSCTIAYAVGMVLTFVVLALTRMGQPALLYLVPFTLITSSVIAWRRREMKKFWTGGSYEIMEHLANAENEENGGAANEYLEVP